MLRLKLIHVDKGTLASDSDPCELKIEYHQTSNMSHTELGSNTVSDVVALLPLRLHVRFNTRLQWSGWRHLQEETRNIQLWDCVQRYAFIDPLIECYLLKSGARPTNDISIEFEIRSELGAL